MKTILVILIVSLLLTGIFSAPYISAAIVSQQVKSITPANPNLDLNMTKIATQSRPSLPGCFFPIVVTLNVTWIGGGLYTVAIGNFYLLVTSRNILITNSTRSSVSNPTNTIGSFQVFSGIPVRLGLSFPETCASSAAIIQLVYSDGSYSFGFPLLP